MVRNYIKLNDTDYRVKVCTKFLMKSIVQYMQDAKHEFAKANADIRKVEHLAHLAHCNVMSLEGIIEMATEAKADMEDSPKMGEVRQLHDAIHTLMATLELRSRMAAVVTETKGPDGKVDPKSVN